MIRRSPRLFVALLMLSSLFIARSASAAAIYSASAVPFSFLDISSTGTVIAGLSGADDSSVAVPIGFTFNFYDSAFTTIGVSSNGLLTFGGTDATFSNADLTTTPALAGIAVFWDDLFVIGSGASNVLTALSGAPGNRSFTLQWNQISFFSGGAGGDTLTFQATLFEASGNILLSYLDLVSGPAAGNNGGSATAGIKDDGPQGPDRLLLAFNNGPNAFVGTGQSTLITRTETTVPEPATVALLGAGLIALARRRSPGRRPGKTALP